MGNKKRNRPNKKKKPKLTFRKKFQRLVKKYWKAYLLGFVTAFIGTIMLFYIVGQKSLNEENISDNSNNPSTSTDNRSRNASTVNSGSTYTSEKETTFTDIVKLYYGSPSINDFYVTGDIKVEKDSEIKPGIYTLVVNAGSGNITNSGGVDYKNYIGETSEDDGDSPSRIRVILVQDEVLKLSGISKASLESVPLPKETSNELGIGTWFVGTDISPGKYKLESNYDINKNDRGSFYPQMSFDIYKFSDDGKKIGETQRGTYDYENNDIVVNLEEGMILEIDGSAYEKYVGINPDDMKLVFKTI